MLIRYVLPVLAAVAFGFAVLQMGKAQQKPAPAAPPVEPAKSAFGAPLAGAGIVEPETENIAVGSHVPGVVDRVLVKVGQTIRPGDPLFRLDDRHLRAELAVRTANLANAEAMLGRLEQLPRSEELPAAEAKVTEAVANLKDQQKMFDRVRSLAGFSEEEFTRRETGALMAKAQLAKAQADLDLLKAGAWKLDKDVSRAAVFQAAAQADQTRVELDRLTARAPWMRDLDAPAAVVGGVAAAEGTAFEVLQVSVRPGEYVGNTPGQALVVLGHVGKLHVRVDIDENEIARFRPGLAGVAKPRGNPKEEFAITFVRVEPYVIPKKSLTGGNTERVDTRVLQVIYAIESKSRPLYVGQQMDVFLNTDSK